MSLSFYCLVERSQAKRLHVCHLFTTLTTARTEKRGAYIERGIRVYLPGKEVKKLPPRGSAKSPIILSLTRS